MIIFLTRPFCLFRTRTDCPTPIRMESAINLLTSATPGNPSQAGSVMPSDRIMRNQSISTSVSKQEQFDCVELMCWPRDGSFSGVCHVDVVDFTPAQADDINAVCRETGVGISGLGYYPNPLSANEHEAGTARDHLRQVIDAAVLLGLSNVNTFIGADHRKSADENFTTFEQVWPELIRYAEDRSIRLGIENCPMLYAPENWPSGTNLARSPDIWRRMFEAIPSENFGLNLDPSHLVWQFVDWIEPIYEFKGKLFHLHAKDMRVERKLLNEHGILALGWHTPKIPGLGDIDWNRWVSALTDVGYDGPICIEVEDEAFYGSVELRKRSLRISRNVLRPLVV